MQSKAVLESLVATLSLLVLSAVRTWAQTAPTTTPGMAPGSGGGGSAVAVVMLILVALVTIGIGVKLYDLRRKRESEAVELQAQISDAFMREQLLYGVPIVATARTSVWKRSPATIEIAGRVPSPQARETALRIARDEARRIRSDFQIEDRVAVVPPHVA